MNRDKDVGIPLHGRRGGGERAKTSIEDLHREIGELLLTVDELEDTLRVLEEQPDFQRARDATGSTEVLHRLESRIHAERARLAALEQRGEVRYDAIEEAMRLSDAMG